MVRRIIAIVLIFVATSIAWAALAGVTSQRTNDSYSRLEGKVSDLWGTEHQQEAPQIYYEKKELVDAKTKQYSTTNIDVIPESSDINVDLALEQRKKGLLWYRTYGVKFKGQYAIKNTTGIPQTYQIRFAFPSPEAIYDDFHFIVDGKEIDLNSANQGTILAPVQIGAGETKSFSVAYGSRGMDRWNYVFGKNVSQVKNFNLVINTDFKNIDFPDRTISPTAKKETAKGWELTWKHKNLISGFRIGMEMPRKINPGPLASQISRFAPVSLLFFFFIIFVLSILKKINLHPMNYFFLAAAFFAFHLLFSYLVDHIDIKLAFIIASVTSVGLVVSYLRLVVGPRFAFVEAGLAQFIYLVVFSYAHFFKGFTGLTITIGSIITLFVLMQLTAKVDWEESFKLKS